MVDDSSLDPQYLGPLVEVITNSTNSNSTNELTTFRFREQVPISYTDPYTGEVKVQNLNLSGKTFTSYTNYDGNESIISELLQQLSSTDSARNYDIITQLEPHLNVDLLRSTGAVGGYKKGLLTNQMIQAFGRNAGVEGISTSITEHTEVLFVGNPFMKKGTVSFKIDSFGRAVMSGNPIYKELLNVDSDGDKLKLTVLNLLRNSDGKDVSLNIALPRKAPFYNVTEGAYKLVDRDTAKDFEKIFGADTESLRKIISSNVDQQAEYFATSAPQRSGEYLENLRTAHKSAMQGAGDQELIGSLVNRMQEADEIKYLSWLQNPANKALADEGGHEFELMQRYSQETGGTPIERGMWLIFDREALKPAAGRKEKKAMNFGEAVKLSIADVTKEIDDIQNSPHFDPLGSDGRKIVANKHLLDFWNKLDNTLNQTTGIIDKATKISYSGKLGNISHAEVSEIMGAFRKYSEAQGTDDMLPGLQRFFRGGRANELGLDKIVGPVSSILENINKPVSYQGRSSSLENGRRLIQMMTEGVGGTNRSPMVQITPLSYFDNDLEGPLRGKHAAHVQFNLLDGEGNQKTSQLMGGGLTTGWVRPALLQEESGEWSALSGMEAFTAKLGTLFSQEELLFSVGDKKYSIFGENRMFNKGEAFSHEELNKNHRLLSDISRKTGVPIGNIRAASQKEGVEINDIIHDYLQKRDKFGGGMSVKKAISRIRTLGPLLATEGPNPTQLLKEGKFSNYYTNSFSVLFNQAVSKLDENMSDNLYGMLNNLGLDTVPAYKAIRKDEEAGSYLEGLVATNRSFVPNILESGGNAEKELKNLRQSSHGFTLKGMNILIADFDKENYAHIDLDAIAAAGIPSDELLHTNGIGVVTKQGSAKIRGQLEATGRPPTFSKLISQRLKLGILDRDDYSTKIDGREVNADIIMTMDELLKHDKLGATLAEHFNFKDIYREIVSTNPGESEDKHKELANNAIQKIIRRHTTDNGELLLEGSSMFSLDQSSSGMSQSKSTHIMEHGRQLHDEIGSISENRYLPLEMIHNARTIQEMGGEMFDYATPMSDSEVAKILDQSNHSIESSKVIRKANGKGKVFVENAATLHQVEQIGKDVMVKNAEQHAASSASKLGRLMGLNKFI